jgi:RNA polymerase sigma factor (sigma-70 family)
MRMPSQEKSITVLIADDHEITRKGIRDFLEQAPDIQGVDEAGDGDEIKRLVAELRPDILLLDYVMPGLDPVELQKWILEKGLATIILVLSAHHQDAYIAKMMAIGAKGYLDKKLRAGELIAHIRQVARGESVFTKEQAERARRWREDITAKLESLSEREIEVLQMLTEGATNRAIAQSLGVTTRTVAKHLENIYKKLGVNSRAEAIHWWYEKGS